jgi:hypothetical protein
MKRKIQKFWTWLAFKVPPQLAYWCFVRVASFATTGPYSTRPAMKVTVLEALKRWTCSCHKTGAKRCERCGARR